MTKLYRASAFSLVEVTLALGVAAFCLLAIFGLLPVGLNSNQASIEQTAAASLARALISDLRNTPKAQPPSDKTSIYFKLTVPGTTKSTHTLFFNEGAQSTGAQDVDAAPAQNPRYRATLTFTPPATATLKSATTVRLLITWPALADKTAVAPPSNYAGSYEVITALDRN